ncbi:MAG: TolC family protein, partial [Phycisphaerales bacterium]
DALKIQMNDPAYPIESEVLLMPVDEPIRTPIEFSFFDAVTTALGRRPEIEQAILTINDSAIRMSVADNARLPRLNLAAQANFNGLDSNFGGALTDQLSGDFTSYLVSLSFEQPLGNRGAEAFFRQRQIERLRAMNSYRIAVQTVLLEVKTSLRNLNTNYQLIEQTRIARLAATENLRTLEVQGETIRGFTPEFLDLQFTRQRALADAELQEMQALVDYTIGLAEYYAATGSSLARRGLRVVPPTTDELLTPRSGVSQER